MRILFLLTTIGCRVKAHHPTGFLSAVLKEAGHHTSYIELDRIDPKAIDDAIELIRPDVVAASTVMQQFRYVRAYINYIKGKFPHIKTILGGTHPILQPDCIEDVEGLDAVCISEGEIPLLQFVNSLENGSEAEIPSLFIRKEGEIIKNPNTFAVTEEDMGNFPLQDREIFPRFRDHDRSQPLGWNVRVLWGRGCPYACSYCAVPSLRKRFREPLKASKTKWVRYPPVDRAIEEIETLRDRWIFDKYIVDDDVFTIKKDWILEFADKYPSHLKDKLSYEANLRVESVDKDIMLALKETGCTLLKFGLENGNAEIRKRILKRPISDEKIIEVFDWAHEIGIPAHTFNIVGIPGETKQSVWETIRLNRRIRPSRVQVTIFFPYVGTTLGEDTFKKGLKVVDSGSYFSGKASVAIENLSRRQIELYAKWMKFLIYLPYAPTMAWQQMKMNMFGSSLGMYTRVSRSVRNVGVMGTSKKVWHRLSRHGVNSTVHQLQVETMGSDGDRPHVPAGLQDLADLAVKGGLMEQYDIEDMDANKPLMDAKV